MKIDRDQLDQLIQESLQRLELLTQKDIQLYPEHHDLFEVTYHELAAALEELQVASEELRQQNEQLGELTTELMAEQKRYLDLFEFAPDGYLVTDLNGVIRAANRMIVRMLGFESRYLAGKPVVSFIDPEKRRDFRTNLSRLPAQRRIEDWEVRIISRRAPDFFASLTVEVINSGDGRSDALLWLVHDLTHKKEMEEALHLSESRFRMIFNEAELGILLRDLEGRLLDCNPAALAMLGYSFEEFSRLGPVSITHPEDMAESKRCYKELAAGKQDHYRLEKRYKHKNGGWVWVRETVSLSRDERGVPRYSISLDEDVTERKQADAEIDEVERRLLDGREAERIQLARDLHDGPLQDLYSITYMLNEVETESAEEKAIEGLHQIQGQISAVIQTLRDTTRELRPPALNHFGLEKAIYSLVDQLHTTHPDMKFDLDLNSDGNQLPEYVRLILYRICQQTVMNVVRHADANLLRINFYLSPEEVYLEIQDNGKGFHVPARWIELLRQGHFGLVGAAERAQSIGGHLQLQSSPGKGTIVRVIVPVDRESPFQPRKRLSILVSEI